MRTRISYGISPSVCTAKGASPRPRPSSPASAASKGSPKRATTKGWGRPGKGSGAGAMAAAAYEFAALLSRDDPEPAFYAAECLRELGLA